MSKKFAVVFILKLLSFGEKTKLKPFHPINGQKGGV